MAQMYADLHLHPTMYAFNRMRNSPDENNPDLFHPWRQMPENLRAMTKGVRANVYAQSDVAKMTLGRLRLAYASITPIESGFLMFRKSEETRWEVEALKLLSGYTGARTLFKLVTQGQNAALHEVTGILRNHGPARKLLQRAIMRYHTKRLDHMRSDRYDYWEEFLLEYEFWASKSGVPHSVDTEYSRGGQTRTEQVQGCYHMVTAPDQLDTILDPDSSDIAIIMTIEGAHTFTMGPGEKRLPADVILSRVEELKNLPSPIFFITLAHHFDNGICGHAHSIPDPPSAILDQSERMHEGFEREGDLGMRVARTMLDINEDLEDQGGRRILLDVKHMSARARTEYYEQIVRPYNAKYAEDAAQGKARANIPVVMSHGAYSGVATLHELMCRTHLEDDYWHRGPYNAWNLNASDEDMHMIHDSDGILGLVFEQRVAGVGPLRKVPKEQYPWVVFHQLLGLVDAILLDDRRDDEDKIKVWDRIMLGTDFDGLIDPVTPYPTAIHLDDFASDLEAFLESVKHTRMIEEIGVSELVEKLCWKNGLNFAKRYLPAAFGK